MNIRQLINELEKVEKKHGNLAVTCTGCLREDKPNSLDGSPFETTVENLVVGEAAPFGKKVRLYL